MYYTCTCLYGRLWVGKQSSSSPNVYTTLPTFQEETNPCLLLQYWKCVCLLYCSVRSVCVCYIAVLEVYVCYIAVLEVCVCYITVLEVCVFAITVLEVCNPVGSTVITSVISLCCCSLSHSPTALPSDVLLHSEQVLPLTGGAARHPLQPGHRHVESRMHPRGDAHGRAALQREGPGTVYIVERVL